MNQSIFLIEISESGRVGHALQNCQRDRASISHRKREKKFFSSLEVGFRIYVAGASLLGTIILLTIEIKESAPNRDT